MARKKEQSVEFETLRRHAEERLKDESPKAEFARPYDETERLLHELQVQHVELEMQNDELHQVQENLEISRDAYAELYEFAPVGYVSVDAKGIILKINLAGAALLETERGLLVTRPFSSFIADSEGRECFVDHLKLVLSRKVVLKCSLSLMGKNGTKIHCHLQSVAVFEKSKPKLIFISIIDDTARFQLENKLMDSHFNLEMAVNELNIKKLELENLNNTLELRITQAVEELRQKDMIIILQERHALMGELINNIAHQWRQPLNTLALVIQKFCMFYGSDKFNKEFLEMSTARAMTYIKQMSGTIEDFMNFFRVDKQKVTFSVELLLERTVRIIEKSYEDEHIVVEIQCEGVPSIKGFPNEYAQVLLNILANARDALLERRLDDALISIRAFSEGGKAVVTITDNGGGINEAIIDKLFDVYFTTRGPDRGTGIGLYMSKTIIETNMGGHLSVRNTAHGAEFRVEV